MYFYYKRGAKLSRIIDIKISNAKILKEVLSRYNIAHINLDLDRKKELLIKKVALFFNSRE